VRGRNVTRVGKPGNGGSPSVGSAVGARNLVRVLRREALRHAGVHSVAGPKPEEGHLPDKGECLRLENREVD